MYATRSTTLFKTLVFCGCCLTAAVIGAVHYLTGPEMTLSLFYLLPIMLSSWYVGPWSGVVMAFSCAGLWLLADLTVIDAFRRPVIPILNETFRLLVFLIIVWITTALHKALLKQKVLANIDPLTQISNRRAFFNLAEREIKRARRYNYSLSILYMDLDNFKCVNDDLGHYVGDELLRLVAQHIKKHIREIDILARLGGDEFCVLLVDSTPMASYKVSQKLQQSISELMRNKNWPVTISIGAATFLSFPSSVSEMICAADQLMYVAKKERQLNIIHKVIDGAAIPA
ncbi:MAG: diguanylate cyclase [Desulfobacteraceae bacterium]|jgi:diguanylate cyclase (GGDEF)-like protein